MSTFETSLLQERWSWIAAKRGKIATALRQLSTEMPRPDRVLLRRLARWFAGNAGFEEAIKRPDVLAICLPLIQEADDESPSEAEIGYAVRVGFCSIGRTLSTRGRLLNLLLYPAVILAALAALTVFLSVAIIPHFEVVLNDFGIDLPRLTKLLFKLAWVVRYSWMYVFGCMVGLAVIVFLMNALTSGRRVVGESWLDQRLKSTRNAAAGWAWHVAMLLESGIGPNNAVEIAGNSQHNHWLKRACRNWVKHQPASMDSNEIANSTAFGNRYHLIDTTLGVDNEAAQVDLLKEIATYYWARSRTIGDWWIQWLVSFLIWFLVAAIVLVVFALYSPMIAIISGLTGGRGGGIWWLF